MIEKINRSQIAKADYNPRKLSEERKAKLSASLDRFGMVVPYVWNRRTGNLVSGHQRLMLEDEKREEGDWQLEVSSVDLDENDEKALNVMLNSPEIAGEFDEDLLQKLLDDLGGKLDFDLNALICREEKKADAKMKKGLASVGNEAAGEHGSNDSRPAEQKNLAGSEPDLTAHSLASVDRVLELRKKQLPELLKRAQGQGLGMVKKDLEDARSRASDPILAGEFPSLLAAVEELRHEIGGVLAGIEKN